MKTTILLIFFALCALLQTGCESSQLGTRVTRFHTLPAAGEPQTFKITGAPEHENSLEFATYSGLVSEKLKTYGWSPAEDGDLPTMLVTLYYTIDNGQTVSGSMPLMGQTGGGTSYSYGSVNSSYGTSTYSGTTYTTPTYGVIGSMPYSTTVYNRLLVMTVVDMKASKPNALKRVFEGRVTSAGTISELSAVMPQMINAMFKKFPGTSGKSEVVTVSRPIKK